MWCVFITVVAERCTSSMSEERTTVAAGVRGFASSRMRHPFVFSRGRRASVNRYSRTARNVDT
jgi:hypothetical protein